MSKFAVATDAFKNTFRSGRLWMIQIVANAALFGLFVSWLWIPVATTWHLVSNIFGALLLAVAPLLLQAGTLQYFSAIHRQEDSGVAVAFWTAWRNLPAFAICVALLCVLSHFAGSAVRYEEALPNYLRSNSPQFVRNLFSLHIYENAVGAGLFTLQWIVAPGLVLPFLAATAAAGFAGLAGHGIATWKRCVGNLSYWGIVAVCAVIGVYWTSEIMGRTPDFRTSTLSRETVSLILRALASYLFVIWAWMFTCSAAGRLGGEGIRFSNGINRQPTA
jgi:hypothetical protein